MIMRLGEGSTVSVWHMEEEKFIPGDVRERRDFTKSVPPPLPDTHPLTATGMVHCYTASDMAGRCSTRESYLGNA
jgi:hypothetical protein